VAIKALLPHHSVEVPDHLMLGMCAIEDAVHGVLHIRNTRSVLSILDILYRKAWETFIPNSLSCSISDRHQLPCQKDAAE